MPLSKQTKPPVRSIGLIEMGRVPRMGMRVLAANLQAMLGVLVDELDPAVIPEDAYQPRRGQYDAGLVLKYLAGFSFPDHSRILAVTEVDLCSPILTYVFGEAELGLKLAIVSGFRLKAAQDSAPVPPGVYYERLVKVALHEIAHTFSLYHCEVPKCLMRVSARVHDLDELDIYFCERCSFVLRGSLGKLDGTR